MKSNIIQYILDNTNMKQKDIAGELSVSTSQVSKWKKGEYISHDKEQQLNSIAGIIDCDIDWTSFVRTKQNASSWIKYVGEVNEFGMECNVELYDEICKLILMGIISSGITLPSCPPIEDYEAAEEENFKMSNIYLLIETVLENYRCIDSWTQTFIGWPDETDLLEVSSNIQMLTYELPMMHVSQAILESNNYNNVTYKNNMIELNKYMRKEIENYCDGLVNNNKTLLTDYFALLNENIYYLEDEAMIHNVQKPMDRYLSYGEKKILNETELLNIKLDKLLSINKVSM